MVYIYNADHATILECQKYVRQPPGIKRGETAMNKNELDEVAYKGLIVCIIANIHSPRLLGLIYRFAQSLYIHS